MFTVCFYVQYGGVIDVVGVYGVSPAPSSVSSICNPIGMKLELIIWNESIFLHISLAF